MSISINDEAVVKYFYSKKNKEARINAFLLRFAFIIILFDNLGSMAMELGLLEDQLIKEGVNFKMCL